MHGDSSRPGSKLRWSATFAELMPYLDFQCGVPRRPKCVRGLIRRSGCSGFRQDSATAAGKGAGGVDAIAAPVAAGRRQRIITYINSRTATTIADKDPIACKAGGSSSQCAELHSKSNRPGVPSWQMTDAPKG